MRILMVGDVVGSGGRRTVKKVLPRLRHVLDLDFVILQGENLAGGFGLTVETVYEMIEAGADIITTGNHVWDKQDVLRKLDDPQFPVLRPLNYPAANPGRGASSDGPVAVVNLIGRVWVGEFDSPFAAIDDLLAGGWGRGKPIAVDLHAEATSEKIAMGWHLDGRASVVFGTHTHIPTADARVLEHGTAFISDVGMTGPYDGVLGRRKDRVLSYLTTSMPTHFEVSHGDARLCGVLAAVDPQTGRAESVERVEVRAQADAPTDEDEQNDRRDE